MMGGCFYSWHCRCANLYTLQSRCRSLINNKSTRAQKSPESAERAGTKKSLHIWRCVMSSRGAFKAAFHQTHLMSRTNNTACQGRRALARAYYNAAQKPARAPASLASFCARQLQKSPACFGLLWTRAGSCFDFHDKRPGALYNKGWRTGCQWQPKQQTMTSLHLKSI